MSSTVRDLRDSPERAQEIAWFQSPFRPGEVVEIQQELESLDGEITVGDAIELVDV